MFDIESVADKMVRIGDTYIPAINIQIEGFPCVIDGDEYDQYFEILWEECDTYSWEVMKSEGYMVRVEARGPEYCLMDVMHFNSWPEFADHFEARRKHTISGTFLNEHF